MEGLPDELMIEILDRLPVKLMVQCRCVCKRRCRLIDSPRFADSHPACSAWSNTNHMLFLSCPKIFDKHSSSLCCIDLGSMSRVEAVDYPLMCYSDQITMVGSCDGLLCIYNGNDDIVIWHPPSGYRKKLPYPAVEVGRELVSEFCVYGFGHDDRDHDYKLLKLVPLFPKQSKSEVSIYSLKDDAWRRLQEKPYSPVYPGKMGVFACGCLHWIMTREKDPDRAKMLVAFDLHAEDFRVMDQPDVIEKKLDMNLAVLGGCLCISIPDRHVGVDVWILREYGTKEPWAKLFTIPQFRVPFPLKFVQPLAYCRYGRRVLVRRENKNLVWYNLLTKCIEKVDISGMPRFLEAEICLRTLVSVDDYGRITKITQRELEEEENWNERDELLSLGFKLVL